MEYQGSFHKWPPKHIVDLALNTALSSTCCSKQVGAVIYNYKTGIALSIGVNKSIITDCDRIFNKKEHKVHSSLSRLIEMSIEYQKTDWTEVDKRTFEKAHDQFVERYEVHAEMNALNSLASHHRRKELALFCTHEPCINCLKHIVNAGIEHVFYLNEYKKVSKCQIMVARVLGVEHEKIPGR